jgi:hypothetical protein
MQKKASVSTLAAITGLNEDKLPSFIKEADEHELRDFMSVIEQRAKHNSIGKVAQIDDGSQAETPDEMLEATLSALIG